MDPDENLREQRELIKRLVAFMDGKGIYRGVNEMSEDIDRLCELVQALDNWISAGGYLPRDWAAAGRHIGAKS